ncbi:MAG: dTMP kinase [Treponema sp.]
MFEGIDGSGTTTQLNKLLKLCDDRNIKAIGTQEPTSSSIGLLIRSFLNKKECFTDETVIRLFATDRCEHIYGKEGIIESIEKGFLVCSDRYLFSSLAYQGFGEEKAKVIKQNEDFPLPTILFFLDIEPKKALERIEKRGNTKELYENINFLTKVRDNYLEIIEFYRTHHPEMKIFILDATESEEDIAKRIEDVVTEAKIL